MTAWQHLNSQRLLSNTTLLEIHDRATPKFDTLTRTKRQARRQEFIANGGSTTDIKAHNLEEREDEIIQSAVEFNADNPSHVLIDLSSLPKRFFFPILKQLMKCTVIETLIATYTVPNSYYRGTLAEDLDTWKPLPLFRPPIVEPHDKSVMVGLGYEPHSLPELLGQDFQKADVNLFLPFPPGPPGYQRNWEFVRKIQESIGKLPYRLIAVSAYNVSDMFDHLWTQSSNGERYTILAPYGPKSMSLAMCLFAIEMGNNAAVFYTQPRIYNPEYSDGVKTIHGQPATYGYCLKLAGQNVFCKPA